MTAASPPPSGARLAALGATAALLHAAFDALSTGAGVAPPYLRLDDAPEVFRLVSPVAVSVAASAIGGIIAAICLVVVAAAARGVRALPLGAAIAAFWIFSAVLARLAWFTTPPGASIAAIACGVPRGLAIGWALASLARRAPAAVSGTAGAA
jgi:hypothetical protein